MKRNFGLALKQWRAKRHMSQLDLGAEANVSSRHIAFLETGRANPSRTMIGQLSDALNIPRSTRNELLAAAGFSALYKSRDLNAFEMTKVRAALDWTLQRHDPYPGFALDRHWVLLAANKSATALLNELGMSIGESILQVMTESSKFRNVIENWPEIARQMAIRLRTESIHLGGDPVLESAAEHLQREATGDDPSSEFPAVVTTHIKVGETKLRFFSTIAQFGTAEDIALSDLRIELLFPADENTRLFLTK